ncbi:MAG: glutamine amidotransferase family protein [Dehalococcoidia bacterium]|jgi:glutamate synthase domain-containing protein 1|nr:glutamine amidotransferase family protein [Dehalococcoidia bacterium]
MKQVTQYSNPHGDDKVMDGCSIFGVMDTSGGSIPAGVVIRAIDLMRDRDNGLGGGFAAYGIYPEHPDLYALHLMYTSREGQRQTEEFLSNAFIIDKSECMDVDPSAVSNPPMMQRYFASLRPDRVAGVDEAQFLADATMFINTKIPDSFVFSAARNMGVFKGVGHPFDIARFFRLEQYSGYLWTAHGRFPTNTPGWWGGAHPFSLLDWTVVHNGEISSYGINRRFLEQYGYVCSLQTDTEVVAYAVDLLVRRHGLPMEVAAKVLAAPFWSEHSHVERDEAEMLRALRITYGSLLLNGPFTVIIARQGEMVGLTDRIRLRPLVVGTHGSVVYLSSEESAIRLVSPELDDTWIPVGGQPVIARLGRIPTADEAWLRSEVVASAH